MTDTAVRRTPRFVYLTDDPRMDPQSRFAWRLDAANHRPLGCSERPHPDLESCRRDAERLHAHIEAVAGDVLLERAAGSWRWRLGLGAQSVTGLTSATSAHAYLRRVECVRAFGQFVDAALAADPDDGVLRSFGERTLRAYLRDPGDGVGAAAGAVPAPADAAVQS